MNAISFVNPLISSSPRRLALVALLAAPVAAQGFKLSAPLPRPVGGDVQRFRVDTDGEHVVYLADQERDNVQELYVARSIGGSLSITKLTGGPGAPPTADPDFEIAPGDQRVVYRGRLDVALSELFSVPIDGGASVRLNGALAAGRTVIAFAISSDGTRVLYLADEDTDNVNELFVAPLDGSGAPRKVSGPLVAGGDVQSFRFSPDGQRAVYLADQDLDGTVELYSAVLDGSRAPVKLDDALVNHGAVLGFEISADSTRVAYRADAHFDEQFELFSAPIDGGAVAELSDLPDRRGRDVTSFALAGTRAVYRASQNTLGVFELYSAPLDGSQPSVRLNTPLVPGHDVQEFVAAPDGGRVAFLANTGATIGFELFSAPADGSATPVPLNRPLPAGSSVLGGFRFAPDSSRVVYTADQDVTGVLELYSVASDGAAPSAKLNPPLVANGRILRFDFAASEGVAFVADALTAGVTELFIAPIRGGGVLRLSGALVPGGDVGTSSASDEAFVLSADGRRVAYVADQDTDEVFELFGASTSGLFPTRKLNLGLPAGPVRGDVLEHQLSADGAWSVYRADQLQDDVFELFRVNAHGTGKRERLNAELVFGGDVLSYQLSPDGQRVVYRADQSVDETFELFVRPLDGATPPVRLNASLPAGGDVLNDYLFTPDGTRVLYVADQDQDEVAELFSVRADGSAPPVKLSGTLVAGGDVLSGNGSPSRTFLRVSPDSTRVVYLADAATDEQIELYSVPVDGSQAPIRLNPALPPGGSLVFQALEAPVRITPLGDRVVYVANGLFSVPIDGSAPAVQLSGTLLVPTGFGSELPQLTSDGARVVFRGSPAVDRIGLYVVPTDGSAPVQLLIPGQSANTEVKFDIEIAGDVRAVYRFGPRNGKPELFSVPLDLSAPPVHLNGALFTSGDVNSFGGTDPALQITPDGASVVYSAQQDSFTYDLYVVPVDGSAPSRRISTDASAYNAHASFRITPDGALVVYQRGGYDLYSANLVSGAVREVAEGNFGLGLFELSPRGDRVFFLAEQSESVAELFFSFLARPFRPAATPTLSVTRPGP
jgi:Tol biopolymer transport system component